jgi:Ca2+-binding RTX toxin-like protein
LQLENSIPSTTDYFQLRGETSIADIWGTYSSEVLYGTYLADTIYALPGDDFVAGGAGDDFLLGSDGNDRLEGDNGNDRLHGDNGNDQLYGGNGNDIVIGGTGNDYVQGGETGNDLLLGESGNDSLVGGNGSDSLDGGADNDIINGYGLTLHEYDVLTGGTGADRFLIGSNHGVSYLGAGHATITDFRWWEGDKIQVRGSTSGYTLNKNQNLVGGAARDTAIYRGSDLIAIVQDTTDVHASLDFVSV